MCQGAAHESHLQHAEPADIGDKTATSAQVPIVFAAMQARADAPLTRTLIHHRHRHTSLNEFCRADRLQCGPIIMLRA